MQAFSAVKVALSCLCSTAVITLTTLFAPAMLSPESALAAPPGRPGITQLPTAAAANLVKYTPNLRVGSLAGRADSDLVEFPNGKRMRVGELRRLEAWGRKARNSPRRQFPVALGTAPSASGKRVNNAPELAAALKLSDNETVVLPSGRRATVGMIKFVQPQVERKLGRSLAAAQQRPGLTGPAIKVHGGTTKEEWQKIVQKPDNTVVESPGGIRITVGELKQELRAAPSGQQRRDR